MHFPVNMKIQRNIALLRAKAESGFTLVELMVASVISVFVIGTIAMLALISLQNYVATSNYVQMNNDSRNAMDWISREIRNASALIGYQTSNPQYLQLTNSCFANSTTITYVSNSIILSKTGQPDYTLLTGCTNFSFQLFSRQPDTNTVSYTNTTTSPQSCKVISLSWSCAQPIVGSKLCTEVMQSAQVMLRNQQ
jgi:Tfp pilus assembly protein PilW